jgi:hypothetical protein
MTRKIAEAGRTQAVGQMLGHHLNFDNLEHATKTILQLRQHGRQQQIIT